MKCVNCPHYIVAKQPRSGPSHSDSCSKTGDTTEPDKDIYCGVMDNQKDYWASGVRKMK